VPVPAPRSAAPWYAPSVSEADLRASRARLAAVAVAERRRFERELHDGVQQELIAVAVGIQLVRRLAESDPPAALESLDELQRDVRDLLAHAQALAGDIYPPLLDVRGLPDALRHAARGASVPARIDAAGVGRYPSEFEGAVYFCCRALLECVAADAETTLVLRESAGALRLELTSGHGIDVVAARDCIEAAGGVMTLDGARVVARIPLPRPTTSSDASDPHGGGPLACSESPSGEPRQKLQ
jgi:signal transduction histidine kinase